MVRIQYCYKLTCLLSYSLAQSLVHLEKIDISHRSRLERIIDGLADQGEILLQSSHGSLLCFPISMTLGITDCSRLQCVFPISTVQGLPSDGIEILLPRCSLQCLQI
ncbi:hypothetical protein V6N13_115694 [Hibiscus sabdariffa]|uniref:Uncharacterized protein n=1 Tax=Hibiscus sabdariffa TaxID=183260 RepID=A0ABR2CUA7_9ROSI